MNTTLYQTTDGFAALAEEWNALLARAAFDTPFLTVEWQRIWWQHFGGGNPLRLYAFRDESGLLRGIAPLFIGVKSGQRKVYLVGCSEIRDDLDVSDYLDVIVEPGYEQPVCGALLEALAAQEWNLIELRDLPEGSRTLELLSGLARECGWRSAQTAPAVCPVIRLPATWDEYLAVLDKKERHELRRKLRRAEQHEEPAALYVTHGHHAPFRSRHRPRGAAGGLAATGLYACGECRCGRVHEL